ncbi:hypothetical protein FMN50_21210 [Rhodobacterales bacterium]|nr:hypothetical protein FMN50_21210 [Rhodobacterales bacterium]
MAIRIFDNLHVTVAIAPSIPDAGRNPQEERGKDMPLRKKILIPALLLTAAFCGQADFAPPVAAQEATAQANAGDTLWQTRCAGPSRAPETLTCQATESIRVKESGQIVFKFDIIVPANKREPVLEIQAPLGFFLPGKVKLAVDGDPLSELEVGRCDGRGCFLATTATPDMIAAMKAGAKLQVDFAPVANKRRTIDVPLDGFSRAMAAIQ